MDIGKESYDAYCLDVGGKSAVTGEAPPDWENLPPEIQRAWVASANAVVDYIADTMAVYIAKSVIDVVFPGKTE